uniref:Uncharacterized protein n=1 Tax=viral metagenome TaxID=1070528 RepID=A0A6M3LNJ4_9ZZZZ
MESYKYLSKPQLIKLLKAYDIYIFNYILEHGICQDGCCPVCLDEFYNNDYQEKENK